MQFEGTVEGKLRNTSLAKKKGIYALYEAVVNSLQSLEDINKDNKYINIILHRGKTLSADILGNIQSISVVDNGVGFTLENLKSFATSDSTYKFKKGCKGIGRFLWLLVFQSVHIESVCYNGTKKINFNFTKDTQQIKDEYIDVNEPDNKTVIKLENINDVYSENFPQDAQRLASLIVEHCFLFFLENSCPEIQIIDGKENISLNKLFVDTYMKEQKSGIIKIKDKSFHSVSIKLYDIDTRNKIIFTAHKRNILSVPLGQKIASLSEKIKDNKGNYYYNIIISGDYLDENVNQDQMKFLIPTKTDDEELDLNTIYMEDIESGVVQKVKNDLNEYLEQTLKTKKDKVEDYIKNKKPGYRVFLNKINDNSINMDGLANNPQNSDIEEYLHFLKYNEEKDLHKLQKKLKKNCKLNASTIQNYRQLLSSFIQKSSDIGVCELANYVCHRKAIIDVMEELTHINEENGKFSLEDELHNLLIPMKINSNDREFQSNNLWLVDERMVFHEMLYSDTYIDSIKEIIKNPQKHSDKRPDVIIFDTPFIYTDDKEYNNSISIVELKRPQRTHYTDTDNPYNEVIKQIEQLLDSKIKMKGAPIEIRGHTRFFVYVLADITPQLRAYLDRQLFKETSDGKGMYLMNEYKKHNVNIEIIPYSKLLNDARKRNEILFRTLGIIE